MMADGVYRQPVVIEQPSGRIFWRREDKTNLQKYVRLETQHLHLHRGVVWAFYHERKGAHHIDVMGHDRPERRKSAAKTV